MYDEQKKPTNNLKTIIKNELNFIYSNDYVAALL